MLERAAGKPFKTLVTEFGDSLGIGFGFDYPNVSDTLQHYGHDTSVKPVTPFNNYKLNWLVAAGNINVSLPGYCKFIQLQRKGLQGKSSLLSQQTFNKLLYGLPVFSFGWFTKPTLQPTTPSPGTKAMQVPSFQAMVYIIFTNSAAEETKTGIDVLLNILQAKYGR